MATRPGNAAASPPRISAKSRRKVALEQRKRVIVALVSRMASMRKECADDFSALDRCNDCSLRRLKCSGDRPCARCTSYGRDCVYPTAVEKVTLAKTELDDLKQKLHTYENILRSASLDHLTPQTSQTPQSDTTSYGRGDATRASSYATPRLTQVLEHPAASADLEDSRRSQMDKRISTPGRIFQYSSGVGRYRGESSGAAFIDRLKNVLRDLPASEQAQPQHSIREKFFDKLDSFITDSMAPRHDPSVNPLWLPSDGVIQSGFTKLQSFVRYGSGIWPAGGIFWLGDLEALPERPCLSRIPQGSLHDFRHLAFYQATLALAFCDEASPSLCHADAQVQHSEAFFARAAILLGNPLDIVGREIRDVSTLGLMALYLIQTESLDAASAYLTLAMHISVMLGAHRGLLDEEGKRIFWSIYSLDRWVSLDSGRPPAISDDFIQLPLPNDVQ